jgi:hypothetical protein
MTTVDKNNRNGDCRMSEPVRLGEILPDVMRDIQARRKMWNDERRMGGNMMSTKENWRSYATGKPSRRKASPMGLTGRQIAVLDDLFAGTLGTLAHFKRIYQFVYLLFSVLG